MAPRSTHYLMAAALAALVAASPITQSTAQTTPAGSYLKTFDNYVISDPQPFARDSTLDVLVHSRNDKGAQGLSPMPADHGAHCEAPPATHQLTGSYDDAVFLCAANPHLMTAINEGGYGVIYLTPGAMADFSNGETVIRFDVSTLRTSGRDWWDIWVTPFEDAMAAPLSPSWPDLSGFPKRGLHVDMGSFSGKTVFMGSQFNNHTPTEIGSCWWCGYEDKLTPSASRRDTFELRVSKTHVKFALLSAATGLPLITWVDKDLATPLDWDRGIVQIGHHSYNPEKACTAPATCGPNTWHWDNLSISQTAPLTMIRSNERWANPTSPTYTFAQPAPPNAMLQVHALATNLDYSLDNGATWATMGKQSSITHHYGGRRTYWQSVPEGTTSVMLRGVEESGPWDANHAVLLSQQVAAQPTPPSLPTQTPEPTPTGLPTQTPGPTSTPQPIPTNTHTPVPATSTPLPPTATTVPATATPGLTDDCTVTVARAGTPVATWRCD